MRRLLLVALFCVAIIQSFQGLARAQVIEDPITASPVSDPVSNPIGEPSFLIWGWDTRNQALLDIFGNGGTEERSTDAWYFSPITGQLTQAAPYQPIFESVGERIGLTILPQRTNLWTYSDPSNVSQLSLYENISIAPRAWSIGTLANAVRLDNTSGNSSALKLNNIQEFGVYVISVYVEMEDGGVPIPSSNGNCLTEGDFCLWMAGSFASNPSIVELVSGNVYRISTSVYIDFTGMLLFGISKSSGQSSRPLWVSGFQVELTKSDSLQKGAPSNYIATSGSTSTVNASKVTWPIASLNAPFPAGNEEMTLAAYIIPRFSFDEMPLDYLVKLIDFSGDEFGVIKPVLFMDAAAPVPRGIISDENNNYAYVDMVFYKNQKVGIFAQIANSQKRAGYILPGQSSITWGEWGIHTYISTGPQIRVCPDPTSLFSLLWLGVYNKKMDDEQLLKNWN